MKIKNTKEPYLNNYPKREIYSPDGTLATPHYGILPLVETVSISVQSRISFHPKSTNNLTIHLLAPVSLTNQF
jgi:hypothetical protein